ncbi:MAG TPA: FkbM family methyltransferase [Kofleriaceae bacterium]|nr:FkbM family methyltransferase [Kofleriaceae bacterium]
MATTPELVRKLQSRLLLRLGLPRPWVSQRLVGHDVVLRDGTVPEVIDYDDAWVHACAQHAEVMFDVGANVGHAALMALLSPQIKQVVLVEANWEALAVAAENIIRNQLASRARFVGAFAAEAADESIDFWTVGTGAAGSMYASHASSAAKAGSVRQVSTVTLDGLAAGYGLVPDLVKIDVEGAEIKVLGGSREIAASQKTRFIVEMHSMAELTMAKNATQVLAWAESVGYAAWYLSAAARLETPDTIKHRGRCHLLLQPTDWSYPAWLAGIPQSAPLPE